MGKKLRKNQQFVKSAVENGVNYTNYLERLIELSISCFEWTGLPDSVDERFLELTLFTDGNVLFFKDEVLGYLCLQCTLGGTLDVYRIPTIRTAYASNGYQNQLDTTNSVIIFNNFLHTNSILAVEESAHRLWEFDRIIDVNVNAQKTPILISCDEHQRLTMKNLYMKYDGNQPFIFGDKNLNPNTLKVMNTDAPYIADKIYELKTQYWNEILTYLGIANVQQNKKERMITDEVMRSLAGTIASRKSRLKSRQQACKQINNMFGLNIWCEFSRDFLGEIENDNDDQLTIGEVIDYE